MKPEYPVRTHPGKGPGSFECCCHAWVHLCFGESSNHMTTHRPDVVRPVVLPLNREEYPVAVDALAVLKVAQLFLAEPTVDPPQRLLVAVLGRDEQHACLRFSSLLSTFLVPPCSLPIPWQLYPVPSLTDIVGANS